MTKVIGPLHSTEARGRVDSLVYNTWRGIRYVKAFVAPEFGSPDPREAQKARVANATAAWKVLTDAQRQAWAAYAELHLEIDWTGVPKRLSGFNWYLRTHTRLARIGANPISWPPESAQPYPLSSWTLTQSDNNAHLVWTYPTQPSAHTYHLQILRQGPYSSGRKPDWHHWAIVTHELLNSSPWDDPLTVNGRYTYWARVLDGRDGTISPLLLATFDFTFQAQTGGVTGRCMSQGLPVSQVTVDVNGDQDITGPDGVFLVETLAHGNYTVTPTKPGWYWVPETKPAHVDPPATTDVGDFEGSEV